MPPKRTAPSIRGDRSRAKLVSALIELLEERSLRDLSVSEIAGRAGMTRSAFYFYFEGKNAAVAAVLEELSEAFVVAGVDSFIGRDSTPRERIEHAMHFAHDVFSSRPRLVVALAEAAAADADSAEVWDASVERVVALITPHLERERRTGIAPPGIDAHHLLHTLTGATIYAGLRESRSILRTGHTNDEFVTTLTDLWHRAIHGKIS